MFRIGVAESLGSSEGIQNASRLRYNCPITIAKKAAMAADRNFMDSLTPKQRRFVTEYLIDLNATQAAIRAGYSRETAGAIGHENLQKPEIAQAIERAMAMRE